MCMYVCYLYNVLPCSIQRPPSFIGNQVIGVGGEEVCLWDKVGRGQEGGGG